MSREEGELESITYEINRASERSSIMDRKELENAKSFNDYLQMHDKIEEKQLIKLAVSTAGKS